LRRQAARMPARVLVRNWLIPHGIPRPPRCQPRPSKIAASLAPDPHSLAGPT